jgi:hypothetical protein
MKNISYWVDHPIKNKTTDVYQLSEKTKYMIGKEMLFLLFFHLAFSLFYEIQSS